jgi:hypothetical protein
LAHQHIVSLIIGTLNIGTTKTKKVRKVRLSISAHKVQALRVFKKISTPPASGSIFSKKLDKPSCPTWKEAFFFLFFLFFFLLLKICGRSAASKTLKRACHANIYRKVVNRKN